MIQGSLEWYDARLGKVTSSGIAAVLSKGRNGGIDVTRNKYMDDLIAERLLGRTIGQDFENDATRWGTSCEAEARTFYALTRDADVEQVGFIDHPMIPMCGASLDGLVGDGFVEIKCPQSETHIETIRKNAVPPKYMKQILFQAACVPDRSYCDFISYDPRLEDRSKRLFVKRVQIDAHQPDIALIEDAVRHFMIDMEPVEARVRAFHRRAAA